MESGNLPAGTTSNLHIKHNFKIFSCFLAFPNLTLVFFTNFILHCTLLTLIKDSLWHPTQFNIYCLINTHDLKKLMYKPTCKKKTEP